MERKRRRVPTHGALTNASERDRASAAAARGPRHDQPSGIQVAVTVAAGGAAHGTGIGDAVAAPPPPPAAMHAPAAEGPTAPLKAVLEQLKRISPESLDLGSNAPIDIATFATFQPPACWSLPRGFLEFDGPVLLHLTRFRLQLLHNMTTQQSFHVYPAGPHGSGKSGTTLLLAAAAKELGWTTLYIPQFLPPAGQSAKGTQGADDGHRIVHSLLASVKEQLFDAPAEEGRAASPGAQQWAEITGVADWMMGRDSKMPSPTNAKRALHLLWTLLPVNAAVPIFVGIDEHNNLCAFAEELETARDAAYSCISALLMPWKSELANRAYRVVLTGSAHSRFLDSLPDGEAEHIRHVPMLSQAEVRASVVEIAFSLTARQVLELVTSEASPLRAGVGLLGKPHLATLAASALHEVTGGLYRHASQLVSRASLNGRRAFDPSCELLCEERKYLIRLADQLFSDRSAAWGAFASHAVRSHLDGEARRACAELLSQSLATASDEIGPLVPRQAARLLVEWGVLAFSEQTGNWRFVSPLARDALLREWTGLRPLSPLRVAFEREVRSQRRARCAACAVGHFSLVRPQLIALFLIRYRGLPERLEPAEQAESQEGAGKAVFVDSAQLDFRSMAVDGVRQAQLSMEAKCGVPRQEVGEALDALLASVAPARGTARVLYLRTGDFSTAFDGAVFLPTPPTLLFLQVTAARDLSINMSRFQAGCQVMIDVYRCAWRAIAGSGPSLVSFSVVNDGRRAGVPLGFMAADASAAWRSTLQVRVLLLLGLNRAEITGAWQTEISGSARALTAKVR